MKLKDWLAQINLRLRGEKPLSDRTIEGLIRYLETAELDCEQVYHALDHYAEMEVRHEDAARLMPLVREHLDMCDECCDEHEALLRVLEKDAKQT
ncbi:MAG: hypothetical protein AB1564_08460 [Chloroflexota bacterium]